VHEPRVVDCPGQVLAEAAVGAVVVFFVQHMVFLLVLQQRNELCVAVGVMGLVMRERQRGM